MNGARMKRMPNTFPQRLNVLYMMYIYIYDCVNDRILMAFQLSDRVSRYLANETSYKIFWTNKSLVFTLFDAFLFHSLCQILVCYY